jgi:hypothetical protein
MLAALRNFSKNLIVLVPTITGLSWLFTISTASQLRADPRNSASTARVVKIKNDARNVVSPTYCLFTSFDSGSVMCVGDRPVVAASGIVLTSTGVYGRFTVTDVEPMKQGCEGLWTAKGLLSGDRNNINNMAGNSGRAENWVLFERELSSRARFLGSGKYADVDLPAPHDPDGDQIMMFDRDGDGNADSVLASQPCDAAVGVVSGRNRSQCAANWVRRGRTSSWRLAQTFHLGNC